MKGGGKEPGKGEGKESPPPHIPKNYSTKTNLMTKWGLNFDLQKLL